MVWVEMRCDVVTTCLLPAMLPVCPTGSSPLFLLSLNPFSACPALPVVRSSAHEWEVLFLVCSARFVLCGWIVTG